MIPIKHRIHKIILGPPNYAELIEALDLIFQMGRPLDETTRPRS